MKNEKLNDKDLLEYIKNTRMFCCFCEDLKRAVLKDGLKAIDDHKGMICGAVEDMYIKRGRY